MKYLNKDIRIAMIEADLSQKELAKRVGYTGHHINKLLNTWPIKPETKRLLMKAIEEAKNE